MTITINCQNPSFLPYLTGKAEWYINNCLNHRKTGQKLLVRAEFDDFEAEVYLWHTKKSIHIKTE